MATVEAEIVVPASLAEVWDLYFSRPTWPSWVDEFRGITESGEGYPEEGGTLVWYSGPAGRGAVTETVLEHEPRRSHRIRYLDENSEGEQLTTFEIAGEGKTKVSLELEYGLVAPTFLPFTDRFFVRPQLRNSLIRTLEGLRAEASGLALPGPSPA